MHISAISDGNADFSLAATFKVGKSHKMCVCKYTRVHGRAGSVVWVWVCGCFMLFLLSLLKLSCNLGAHRHARTHAFALRARAHVRAHANRFYRHSLGHAAIGSRVTRVHELTAAAAPPGVVAVTARA